MATCSFASLAHVTSLCGSSSRDPQDIQCITLNEFNEDVSTHLKELNVGPDTINDEKTLLLGRAGALSYDPYGPARAFIAKPLRNSPYEGRTRWREQGRKKPSGPARIAYGPARIAYGSSRDAN